MQSRGPFDLRIRSAFGKVQLTVLRGRDELIQLLIPASSVPGLCRDLMAAANSQGKPPDDADL